jgi:hypothetical protein
MAAHERMKTSTTHNNINEMNDLLPYQTVGCISHAEKHDCTY